MTIVFDERALPRPGERRPNAEAVAFRLLADHPLLVTEDGARVGVETAGEPSARRPPWVRVHHVGHAEPARRGESCPVIAFDVWAPTDLAAGDLAQLLAVLWPVIKKTTVPGEAAYVSGTWLTSEPVPMDEPDEDLARYHLEGAMRLHPAPLEAP